MKKIYVKLGLFLMRYKAAVFLAFCYIFNLTEWNAYSILFFKLMLYATAYTAIELIILGYLAPKCNQIILGDPIDLQKHLKFLRVSNLLMDITSIIMKALTFLFMLFYCGIPFFKSIYFFMNHLIN